MRQILSKLAEFFKQKLVIHETNFYKFLPNYDFSSGCFKLICSS